ncbi:uracil-DNA glycosylase [Acidithiobacillus marinus]|uniref:Type-4 uracil-DNA glycosylase n=1 Tax=Acidithiobacillus marinus TaxID=187490 RepID=A0A2I1DLN8_9PROT|nr:uracil-DNA glycosylase [Acidithiobacillus marinus]PKY10787.1 uracil-DNA glycosylase [Acidithiobacillus marinus]
MSTIFNAEQRRFLKLLGLSIPGESPLLPQGAIKEKAGAVAHATASAHIAASTVPSDAAPAAFDALRAAARQAPRQEKPSAPQSSPVREQSVPLPPEEAEVPPIPEPTVPTPLADPHRLAQIAASDWRDLQIMVHNCRACGLGETRQHAVFGAGNPRGSWLFVGEAPGAEEDRRGEAFVGRGGQLLDNMLKAMGLTRQQDVYIANVLKCRPPNNRDPLGPEVQSCLPHLQRQIALLQPRIIVALGRFAAQSLLQVTTPIGQLRGQTHHYQQIPLIVTYHPAYLLRSPLEKRKAWEDLQLALRVVGEVE